MWVKRKRKKKKTRFTEPSFWTIPWEPLLNISRTLTTFTKKYSWAGLLGRGKYSPSYRGKFRQQNSSHNPGKQRYFVQNNRFVYVTVNMYHLAIKEILQLLITLLPGIAMSAA